MKTDLQIESFALSSVCINAVTTHSHAIHSTASRSRKDCFSVTCHENEEVSLLWDIFLFMETLCQVILQLFNPSQDAPASLK